MIFIKLLTGQEQLEKELLHQEKSHQQELKKYKRK